MNQQDQMKDRIKSCCFTGHRVLPNDPEFGVKLYRNLQKIVWMLINEDGITHFYTGGALGFDTLAADVVLEMRRMFPDIQLTVAVPYPDQSKEWSMEDRMRYDEIKSQADFVEFVSPEFTEDCMRKRNYYMVDHSYICIYCMMSNARSGTLQTVQYARKEGLRMIDLLGEIRRQEEDPASYYPSWQEQLYTKK